MMTYLKLWHGVLEQRLADMMESCWQIRSLGAKNCAQRSLIHIQVQEIGLHFQKSEDDSGGAEYSVLMWYFQAICFDLLFFFAMEGLSTINVTTQHTH
jgi:hypothetical protein